MLAIDEFLCMVAGCALGTDVCHWIFLSQPSPRSTRWPFNENELQEMVKCKPVIVCR